MKKPDNCFILALGVSTLAYTGIAAGCGGGASNSNGSVNNQPPVHPGAGIGTGFVGGHGPSPVVLGTAANYVILSKSGISNVPTSVITGSIAVSPIASTAITGFSLGFDGNYAFATSLQVSVRVYAANFAAPIPATLTTAVSDMQTAYSDAAGRVTPDSTELAGGNIGGLTLPAGLYKWSNTVNIGKDVTLTGGPNDVWIFQIAGGLKEASAVNVVLAGGALAKNVYWQVGGIVSLDTTAHMEGELLSRTGITLNTGASINGRLLAQTAVTLQSSTVVQE